MVTFGSDSITICKTDDPFLPDLQKNGSKTLMGYSQSNKLNYLGFGATAISFFNRTFYRNVSSIEDYYRLLDEDLLPVCFQPLLST